MSVLRLFVSVFLLLFHGPERGPNPQNGPLSPRLLARASALRNLGQYAEALLLTELALASNELLWEEGDTEPQHVVEASGLELQGLLYVALGDFAHAEPPLQRALELRRLAPDSQQLHRGRLLSALASVYIGRHQYDHAQSLLTESLQIFAKSSSATGNGLPLYYLGLAAYAQGDYVHAQQLLEKASSAASLDHDTILVVESVALLGDVYVAQGRYERAEAIYHKELQHIAHMLGPAGSCAAARLRIALGQIFLKEGNTEHAQALFESSMQNPTCTQGLDRRWLMQAQIGRAVTALRRSLNPSNPRDRYPDPDLLRAASESLAQAQVLAEPLLPEYQLPVWQHLGILAVLSGDPNRGEQLLLRAAQVAEQEHGAGHPDTARVLHSLSRYYRWSGAFATAAEYGWHELAARQAALGPSNPDLLVSLFNLAVIEALLGKLTQTDALLAQALAISDEYLRNQGLMLPESRLAQLLSRLRAQDAIIYSLLQYAPYHRGMRQRAMEAVLFGKGRAVDELAQASRLLNNPSTQPGHDVLFKLRELRGRIANLALHGLDGDKLDPQRQQYLDLTKQAEHAEQELAWTLSTQRRRLFTGPGKVVPVLAASLPSDAALVELIRFSPLDLARGDFGPPGPPRYLALVLGHDGAPQPVDLGPAAPIDDAATSLLASLSGQSPSYLQLSQEVYRRVMAPLLPALGVRKRVIISPDSQLNLVPFAALHDGQGFLLDRYEISYLTSGRDLLVGGRESKAAPRMVVLADPDFNVRPKLTSGAEPLRGTGVRDRGLQLGVLQRLPGTRLEAAAIRALWPDAELLLGPDASEPALLGLQAPSVLHIATHGLYLRAAAERDAATRGFAAESEPQPNPLLRSALVLAGAQALWARTDTLSLRDRGADGLATALEVSGMNLSGTQLVVLSTCDSGRGDVLPGDGVYGLRRSIQVAGAETLVASLWRINGDYALDKARPDRAIWRGTCLALLGG